MSASVLRYALMHPTQKARLRDWAIGPRQGEDANAFAARANGFLTDDDRDWIVAISDDQQAKSAFQ